MLTAPRYNQKGIFERVVRAKNGALVRVHFEVYELDGEVKGRVLAIEPIFAIKESVAATVYLPGREAATAGSTEYISKLVSVISPYNELYFFTSQPTRAPAIK